MNISLPTEDYRVRFWKVESEYVFVIDELSLIAFGPDLVSAYDALMAKKGRLGEQAERVGIDLPPPGSKTVAERGSATTIVARGPLWMTAARAAVATLSVLAVTGALGITGLWAANHAVESRGGLLKIVRGTIALAAIHSRSLSGEARASMRSDLQAIIVNASSLIGDLEPAGDGKIAAPNPASQK